MKRILPGLVLIFILFGQELSAQFMTSGDNLFSNAKFVAPGNDSSSYVLGEFVTYEINNGGGQNFTSYTLRIGDSIAVADSCGYEHFSNKLYVTKVSKKGVAEWIHIAGSCDTLSSVQLIAADTDEDDNLLVLGTFHLDVELAGSAMSTASEWDMFIYKISPEGNVLWQKSGFSSGDTSAVIPSDIKVIANELYISGSFSGAAAFSGDVFQSEEKQFFLLKTDNNGNDLEVSTALPVHPASSSDLNNIDFLSNNDVAGSLSLTDSVLIVKKISGSPVDTIYTSGGFQTNVLYVIDSSDIVHVSAVVDSFFIADPPNPNMYFYLVEEAAILTPGIVLDTVFIPNPAIPEKKNHLSIFRGDSLALSFEIPALPHDFLVDRNDNSLYGLYNYASDLQFREDLIVAGSFPATALVKYRFSGGASWMLIGSSPTDTAQSTSFCIDPESNLYISGSVGNSGGNHTLSFGSETLDPSYDEDGFIVKVNAGNVEWGQIIGDSATDRMNDIYALDRFTIVGAGEYSKRIDYDKFSISTGGVRDMYVASIQPYPDFNLEVNSFRDENLPLCSGDSILLVATSSHDCTFQWIKDSVQIAGEHKDSLWVKESGTYYIKATSNLIFYDNLDAYSKSSKSFPFEYNAIPIDSISVADSTSFCFGDKAVLSIELNSSDSCSWYELNDGFLKASSYITVTQSGLYFARIEGESGCVSMSDTLQIMSIEAPNDSIAILGDNNLFCDGDSLQIESFDPEVNTYEWYKDGVYIGTETASTKYFKEDGAYSVKIISENNCAVLSDTVTLVKILPPVLQAWFDAKETGICEGEKAEIRLSNHGQTAYYWFYNNDSIKDFSSPIYLAEDPGFYRATLVKEGVCVVHSDTFLLQVHPYPSAGIKVESDSVICDNETARLLIETTENLQYKWFKNGEEVEGVAASSIDISESGTYYSVFSNEFSCSAETRPVTILVKKAPSLSLSSEGDKTAFCKNDSIRLIVENSGTVSYQWQRNSVDIPVTDNTYYGKLPGEYRVLLFDSNTQCTAQTNVLDIQEWELPENSIIFEARDPLCERDTLLLSSSADAIMYEWSLNGTIQVLENEQTFKATKNGLYRVKVKNENNCMSTSPPVSLSFLESQIPPINQDIQFLSTLSYDQIQWYKNNEPINGASTQVYSVNESGFYHVEVSHSNGCIAASRDIQICVPFPEIEVNHNVLTASEGQAYQWFFGTDTIFGATSAVYSAQLSGSYSVEIELSDFCVSRSAEVEVCYPTPVIEVQPNNVLKSSLGLSYQWYLNNEAISGADARLYVVTLEGMYKVEVEDLDHCITFSDQVYMQSTGKDDLSMGSIEMYPNPFDDKVYLKLPDGFDFDGYILQIQNAAGVVIGQQKLSANPETIHLPSLASGLYVAILYNDTQRIHLKLIKK